MTDIFRTVSAYDFYRDPNYLFYGIYGIIGDVIHTIERQATRSIANSLVDYSRTKAKPRTYATLLTLKFMQLINGREINEGGSFVIPKDDIYFRNTGFADIYSIKRKSHVGGLGLTIDQGRLLQELEDGVANFDEFYKIWDNLGTYLTKKQIEENRELIGRMHHVVASLRGNTKAPSRPYIDMAIADAGIHDKVHEVINNSFARVGIRKR